MNDKQHHRNRDARIGDIKRRPGIGVADVQIKKEKVDHVPVKQAICQISQNAGKEKRERYISPGIRPARSHQQNRHHYQCDDGNNNEESVVAPERSKRGASIGDVNQVKKVRQYNARIVRADGSQYPVFRQLVQSVERKREEEDESHLSYLSFRAKRSAVEESRGDIESKSTGCLDFARHDDLMGAYHGFAPIAQIRVRCTRTDRRPMSPAAVAFFVRGFRHRSARFFRLLNRQITHNKKFLQFFLWDFFCDIGIRIQNNAGFQRVADQFFLACVLDRLADDAAQPQKLFNLLDCLATPIL